MKKLLFLPLFLLLACTSKEVKIPSDIISKEKMIEVYFDVHVSDGMVINQKIKDVKISNQLKKSYLVGVLKKHGVSMEKYEKSNVFYEDNEALMVEIYSEVMIKFSEEQALLEGEKKEVTKEEMKK